MVFLRNYITWVFLVFFCCTSTSVYSRSFFPSAEEWGDSLYQATISPATWVPLLGAGLIAVTNTDQKISNWAAENTPIFGSQSNADRVSSNLRNILEVMSVGTLLISPPRQCENWLMEKGFGFAAEVLAVGAADGTTALLQQIVHRERPNQSNDHSFPSGHTTDAFANAAIIVRNVDDMHLTRGGNFIARAGVYTMASTVAWARVEADAHYPIDVLVGAAIGNFIASTIYYAFVGPSCRDRFYVSVSPVTDGAMLNIGRNW